MEVNFVNIALTAALVYALLKAEYFFQLWRWRRGLKKRVPESRGDESTKGFVVNAAQAALCGRCGEMVKNYVEYADGDRWCVRCDNEVE